MQEQGVIDNLAEGTGYEAAMAGMKADQRRTELNNEIAILMEKTNRGENEDILYGKKVNGKRTGGLIGDAIRDGNTTRLKAIAEMEGRRRDTANRFMDRMEQDLSDGNYKGSGMFSDVAKQMSTGENAQTYRTTNAQMFDYGAQVNKGIETGSYSAWSNNLGNIEGAYKNHITNGQELYSQSSNSLEAIKEQLEKMPENSEQRARMIALAKEAHDNPYLAKDTTKNKLVKEIADLGGEASSESSDWAPNQGVPIP